MIDSFETIRVMRNVAKECHCQFVASTQICINSVPLTPKRVPHIGCNSYMYSRYIIPPL